MDTHLGSLAVGALECLSGGCPPTGQQAWRTGGWRRGRWVLSRGWVARLLGLGWAHSLLGRVGQGPWFLETLDNRASLGVGDCEPICVCESGGVFVRGCQGVCVCVGGCLGQRPPWDHPTDTPEVGTVLGETRKLEGGWGEPLGLDKAPALPCALALPHQLLGLLLATEAALTYFGAHFAVMSRVSPEGSPFEALHRWAFFTGISLAGLLGLGAVLSAAATVREAGRLMAGGFLCFSLVFCALVQVTFWRLRNPTQVEDAILDTYDLAYDRAVRSSPGAGQQELLAIQDTFLCCGKSSPPSLLGSAEADLCPGEGATSQDCLQGIRSFLRTHGRITSILASVGLASTMYAMLLSSFLWFAICSGRGLDRKGTYALSPRAPGHQPREPSFFRCSRGGPALHQLDDLGPSRCSGGPRLLQDH